MYGWSLEQDVIDVMDDLTVHLVSSTFQPYPKRLHLFFHLLTRCNFFFSFLLTGKRGSLPAVSMAPCLALPPGQSVMQHQQLVEGLLVISLYDLLCYRAEIRRSFANGAKRKV